MLNLLKSLIAQKRRAAIIAAATLLLLIAAAIFYVIKINKSISRERDQQALSARVEVEQTRLRAPSSDGFTIYLNASDVRAVCVLADTRYLATSGGLIALDESGAIKRRYTTLDGLTDNDLTTLAVFRDRLFIGTATAGLMAFDGNTFTGYSFIKPKATRVSVLLATETELLIGTLDGGLFEYDGEQFSRRVNSATGADFSRVTALLPYEFTPVYRNTGQRALYLARGAHRTSFDERRAAFTARDCARRAAFESRAGRTDRRRHRFRGRSLKRVKRDQARDESSERHLAGCERRAFVGGAFQRRHNRCRR